MHDCFIKVYRICSVVSHYTLSLNNFQTMHVPLNESAADNHKVLNANCQLHAEGPLKANNAKLNS